MGWGAHSNGQSSQITQTDHGGDPREPGRRGRGGKEEEWTDCVADDLRLFGIGDGEEWKTVALDPGKWWEVVMEGGARLWPHGGRKRREQLKFAETRERQKKRTRLPLRRV